jgi:hypothetical protein
MKALHIHRLWATFEFLCVFVAILAVLSMLYQYSIAITAAFVSTARPAEAQDNPFWTGYHGQSSPWQWEGQTQSEAYWLNETQDALATMQDVYWNGTYWVSTCTFRGEKDHLMFMMLTASSAQHNPMDRSLD